MEEFGFLEATLLVLFKKVLLLWKHALFSLEKLVIIDNVVVVIELSHLISRNWEPKDMLRASVICLRVCKRNKRFFRKLLGICFDFHDAFGDFFYGFNGNLLCWKCLNHLSTPSGIFTLLKGSLIFLSEFFFCLFMHFYVITYNFFVERWLHMLLFILDSFGNLDLFMIIPSSERIFYLFWGLHQRSRFSYGNRSRWWCRNHRIICTLSCR